MYQTVFTVFIFETRFHTACLEIFAVGAAGNFAVGVLRRNPNFQVIGFGCTETHVAGTQSNHAVGQFQRFQNIFSMADHFFQRFVWFFWMNDLHHFHFVELVLANQTAHVFAVCARFGTETWRMRSQFQRQIAACHDAVGNSIGQRHFCGRNQILRFLALVAATGNVE